MRRVVEVFSSPKRRAPKLYQLGTVFLVLFSKRLKSWIVTFGFLKVDWSIDIGPVLPHVTFHKVNSSLDFSGTGKSTFLLSLELSECFVHDTKNVQEWKRYKSGLLVYLEMRLPAILMPNSQYLPCAF